MATNKVQPGEVLTLTAPSGGVVSGNGYKIGSLFVVACITAEQTEKFTGHVVGVHTLPKATGAAWAEGDLVYWDDSSKNVTKTATSNLLIGHAVAVAGSADTSGNVRLTQTGVVGGS